MLRAVLIGSTQLDFLSEFWMRGLVMERVTVLRGLLLLCLAGCGGAAYQVAPAGGTVQFKGAPVSAGSITLVPIASAADSDSGRDVGKPAKAELKSDGTFQLSTYGQFDGAVVGRHRVIFEGPEGEGEAEEIAEPGEADENAAENVSADARKARSQRGRRMALKAPAGLELEVKAGGENQFTIELEEGPAEEEEPVE